MLPFQARLKVKEIVEKLKKIKGKNMEDFDFDSLLEEVENTPETPEKTEEIEKVEESQELNTEPSNPVVTEEPEVPATPISVPDMEYAVETEAYIKAKLQLDIDMKTLKQELKDLNDEFKDQGVDIKSVNKALNEIKKELKETPDEAKNVTNIKSLIRSDDNLISTLTLTVG